MEIFTNVGVIKQTLDFESIVYYIFRIHIIDYIPQA